LRIFVKTTLLETGDIY